VFRRIGMVERRILASRRFIINRSDALHIRRVGHHIDMPTAIAFAVIFDFDGTILDSETAEFHSHHRYFAEHQVDLTEEEWCRGIGIVQPATHWWEWLCARTSVPPTYERFREATRAYFTEHVRMEPMPGITALVDGLVAAQVPRAVASAASARWVMRALEDLGLSSSFDAVVTGDQVARPKPAPDVYVEAARRLGIAPERAVALEDSGPGLAAARAAGMRTVVIPHRLNLGTHDFEGADLRVSSAADLTLEQLRELVGGL
jgi:HAD superfamily hydrolase (TIGR01509 family)